MAAAGGQTVDVSIFILSRMAQTPGQNMIEIKVVTPIPSLSTLRVTWCTD